MRTHFAAVSTGPTGVPTGLKNGWTCLLTLRLPPAIRFSKWRTTNADLTRHCNGHLQRLALLGEYMNRESEMARGIVGKYKVQSGINVHVVSVGVLYVPYIQGSSST